MFDFLDLSLWNVGSISIIVFTAIYIYFKITHSYWKSRDVPYIEPKIPFGNFTDLVRGKKGAQEFFNDIYKELEGHKIGGIYRLFTPSLVIRDPEVIKDVLVKHFDHFYHRGIRPNVSTEPLSGHLFALSGSKWRNLRIKLSPTFTSGKMKMMFGTLTDCGKELQNTLQTQVKDGSTIEIKDLLARYSTDIIASCAFGVECNCLKNPDAEFRNWGRRIFKPTFKANLFRIIALLFPSAIKFLRISFFPKEISAYFTKMVSETVEYREKNDVHRNDFMQLLIQLKNKTLGGNEEEIQELVDVDDLKSNAPFEITMDVIAAQAFVFFAAGFETSSTTMTFCLYELAVNPDIQEKVRAEIDAVLENHGGNITYESISEMEYLDKVVCETLRKYPPVPTLTRECTKDIKLESAGATIEKGIQIILPVMALHHDPKYFPEPEKFDPERFTEEEKNKRPHFCYLPFGEGPRLCIGMRFGLMQTKVGLISILSKYEVQPSEKTSIPLEFDPKSFVLAPVGGMWLKTVKRTDI